MECSSVLPLLISVLWHIAFKDCEVLGHSILDYHSATVVGCTVNGLNPGVTCNGVV